DGAQITPEASTAIIQHMEAIDELSIEVAEEQQLLEQNLLTYIGEEIDQPYIEQLMSIRVNQEVIHKAADDLTIVFTPLHGTAAETVPTGREADGLEPAVTVREQAAADPNRATVPRPKPEDRNACELAIEHRHRVHADLLLGTAPDGDRLGVAAKNSQGVYE